MPKTPEIQFEWQSPQAARGFRTAVSLHSHTLHSRENLGFLSEIAERTPGLDIAVRNRARRYRQIHGADLDFSRAWWTPPLSASDALHVERTSIDRLGLDPVVSLTDHDNVEAFASLRAVAHPEHVPASVEWTVPFRDSFFHLGVHNLPPDEVETIMKALAAYTACPDEQRLPDLLEWLDARPEILIVFNHPMWDERRVGGPYHLALVHSFLGRLRPWLHALELNGLRSWRENQQVLPLARAYGLPVVSGGDRHAREPNANVNLTNASTFAGFAAEVREGHSRILFLTHYRESLRFRMIQNIAEVLREDEGHRLGWTRWTDRIFLRGHDNVVRSLAALCGTRGPIIARQFVWMMGLLDHQGMRGALRSALAGRGEFA
ncbi:MAG: hypothetical protein IPM24_05425 [Bryobacterales bacterium]|nr:hypothetical protein [Bryobacterales bacterium]